MPSEGRVGEIILVGDNNKLRRIKIRIDGCDGKRPNSCRQISVLAENIDVVYDAILRFLKGEV